MLGVLAMVFVMGNSGCSNRGELALLPDASIPTERRTLLVATSRAATSPPAFFSNIRSDRTNYVSFEISVPPERAPGEIEYPRRGRVDPRTEFLIASSGDLGGPSGFTRAINEALGGAPAAERQGSIFVHGFNTNYAEGVVRATALALDTGRKGVNVVYSWPSAGKLLKYLDDRESALFARDSFKETLTAMSRSRLDSYVVVGHSMGTFVVMDTLRELAQERAASTLNKISAVVLISADLDTGVFRKQAPPVLAAGVPIILLTTDDDLALRLSSRIRGQGERLGDIKSRAELGGLDIPVFDFTSVETGDALRHFKIGSSPEILAFLRRMNEAGTSVLGGSAGGPLIGVSGQSLEGETGVTLLQ